MIYNWTERVEGLVAEGLLEIDESATVFSDVNFVYVTDEKITIGKNALLRSGCVIYSGCNIGEDVKIGNNAVVQSRVKIGARSYLGPLVAVEEDVTIGEDCGIGTHCLIAKYTVIEDHVFLAPHVSTGNDWSMRFHREGHGKNLKGSVIRRGVRIGLNATILPGLEIGANSIIGVGTVVTREVPKKQIWFGSPARFKGTVPEGDWL